MDADRVIRVILAAVVLALQCIGPAAPSWAQAASSDPQPAQPDINSIQTIAPGDLKKLLEQFGPSPAPPTKNIGDWNGSWYGSVLLPGKGAVPVTLTMSDGKIVAFDIDGGPYQIFSDHVMPDTITFFANNQFLFGRPATDPTSGNSWNVTITTSGSSLDELQLALKGDTQTLTTTLDFRTSPPPHPPPYLAPPANNPPGFFKGN
jgi:hypothetical protein